MQEITLSLPCVSSMVSVEVLDSTQNLARELACQGCENHTLVLAYEQTEGFGQEGKTWSAGRGGVYFTLVLCPQKNAADAQHWADKAAQAIVHAFKHLFEFKTKVKKPNDVLALDPKTKTWKKIAGVLVQPEQTPEGEPFVLLGVGINVNNKLPASLHGATSVKKLLGREIDPEWILQEVLEAFFELYAQSEF